MGGAIVRYFSLDDSIENIKDRYTRTLFKEVHSSYVMGNYRSAVVMLWSVVVTDLVQKLKELESIYNDDKAMEILSYIEKQQKNHPTSSEWELGIVTKFKEELNFFEEIEVTHLKYMQKMRHLSAHPVITNADILFTPNKELVYSLIQNAFECVFTKEALFSSKIIMKIFEDLNLVRKTLTKYEDVKVYFVHKFLNKMSDQVLIKFIKTLWGFIFKKDGVEIKENRSINIKILKSIIDVKELVFIKFLETEKNYISSIDFESDLYENFLEFIARNKKFLKYFDDATILSIKASVGKSTYKNYKIIKYDNPIEYIEYLSKNNYKNFDMDNNVYLKIECREKGLMNKYYQTCVEAYTFSPSYDDADYNFENFISPNINEFEIGHLEKIVKESEVNSQTYDRRLSARDHAVVIKRILELDSSFDFKDYDNFTTNNASLIG